MKHLQVCAYVVAIALLTFIDPTPRSGWEFELYKLLRAGACFAAPLGIATFANIVVAQLEMISDRLDTLETSMLSVNQKPSHSDRYDGI